MMKLSIGLAAAMMALAFVPLASANADLREVDVNAGPCILYPWSYSVGGTTVYTGDYTVKGRSYTVLFLTVTTQDVTVYGTGLYVPYVTTVYTPGVCYGSVGELIGEIATLA